MVRTSPAIDVEFGKPMVVDDVELPDPGPHHVVVKQAASGVTGRGADYAFDVIGVPQTILGRAIVEF